MTTSTLTRKGQTTIPREVRERLGLKPGDSIAYIQDADGRTAMVPVRRYSWRDLVGIAPAPEKAATLEEIEEAIIEGAVERATRW